MAWPTKEERLMKPMNYPAKKPPVMPMANKTAMKRHALAKALRK